MTQLALYRTYRPKDFNEIYGQDHIARVLRNAIKEETFSHAYLFCGPRGTGKTSAARIIAKAINCLELKEGNPCNACTNCKLINENRSLDIIEIDAASHTQVDNIREVIIERTHFAPTTLKYKVYIIDEAHMLSKSSFNALLKTLEEPPKHAIFILATTEVNKVPATIVSRCQKFDFKRINNADLEKRLKQIAGKEKIEISSQAISLITKSSEGGFRDAISFLDQISSLKKEEISEKDVEEIIGASDMSGIEDYLYALIEKDSPKGIGIIRKVVDDGYNIDQFYKNIIDFLRKLMLADVAGVSEVDFSLESSRNATEILKRIETNKIIEIIDILTENEQLYKYSSLPQLGLEVATVKICNSSGETEKKVKKIEVEDKKEESISEEKTTKSKKEPTTIQWQQLLMEVKSRNNSIHAFLKVCEPEFEGDLVCLYFPYKFHKERIEEAKNRRVVEEALKRIYGISYKVRCAYRTNNNHNHIELTPNDDLLEDALEIFGGEVID